jgi:hypothetical protein
MTIAVTGYHLQPKDAIASCYARSPMEAARGIQGGTMNAISNPGS